MVEVKVTRVFTAGDADDVSSTVEVLGWVNVALTAPEEPTWPKPTPPPLPPFPAS
jgi:hypothetical protein